MPASRWMPTASTVAGLALALAVPLAAWGQGEDNTRRPAASGPEAGPRQEASGPRLVVVNKSGNSLSVLDPATGGELATVPTGHAPHEVAVSPDGRFAYVTDYGTGDRAGHTVTVVDLDSYDVERTIDLSPHTRPHGIQVVSDGTLWVTTEGSRHVLHVDPSSGDILQAAETGQEVTHMVAVAEEADRVYTANIGSGTVTAVEASSGRVIRHIPTGDGAEGLDLSPDGRRLYVTNRAAGTLSEIAVGADSVTRSLEVGDFPIRVGVLPDGSRALVSNAEANEVALVDLNDWTVARRMAVGAVPVGVEIRPDGRTAYVANTRADRISVLDLADWTLLDALTAGREPDGMAWVAASP